MSSNLASLIQSPAQPGVEDEFAGEGNVLVNQITDSLRSLRAAAVRELLHRGTVLELQVDSTVNTGMDDDGRQNGYVLNSLHPLTGETLTHTNGRALLVRFPNANSATAHFRITGDEGDWPLLGNWPQTQLPADGVITAKPYLIIFATGKGWFVIGREAVLSQALILAALEDGGFPGSKIADGGVDTLQLAALAVEHDQLGLEAVRTVNIRPLAITRGLIGARIITGIKIALGTILGENIMAGTITRALLAADALPAWTTEVITTTGATSKTFTAREVEVEIYGSGGGGANGFIGSGSSGANSTLAYSGQTIQVVGGRGGTGGTNRAASPYSYPAPQTFPTITGTTILEVQGAGAGGGVGGNSQNQNSTVAGSGTSGSLVRIFINKTTASSTALVFNLAVGGSGRSTGRNGAPARALLRYR